MLGGPESQPQAKLQEQKVKMTPTTHVSMNKFIDIIVEVGTNLLTF